MSRRPITIWIALVLTSLFALMFIVGGAFILWNTLAITASESGKFNAGTVLRQALLLCALVAIPLLALHGLWRRKVYGRWLSIVILLVWLGSSILMHPNPFSLGQEDCRTGPVPCFQYSNRTQEEGARAGRLAVEAGLLVLIFKLAFAKSVKDYFQSSFIAESNPSRETTGT